MRVTIDVDSKSRFSLWWRVRLGTFLLRSPPNVVRLSAGGRGYHIIWQGLPITFKQSVAYRYVLGDDRNRIKLDLQCSRSCKQILFNKKKVKWNTKYINKRA